MEADHARRARASRCEKSTNVDLESQAQMAQVERYGRRRRRSEIEPCGCNRFTLLDEKRRMSNWRSARATRQRKCTIIRMCHRVAEGGCRTDCLHAAGARA